MYRRGWLSPSALSGGKHGKAQQLDRPQPLLEDASIHRLSPHDALVSPAALEQLQGTRITTSAPSAQSLGQSSTGPALQLPFPASCPMEWEAR